MKITITKDIDAINGRTISIGEQGFTFPLDMSNTDIIEKIKSIVEAERKIQKDFTGLDRSGIVRLTNTTIEVI